MNTLITGNKEVSKKETNRKRKKDINLEMPGPWKGSMQTKRRLSSKLFTRYISYHIPQPGSSTWVHLAVPLGHVCLQGWSCLLNLSYHVPCSGSMVPWDPHGTWSPQGQSWHTPAPGSFSAEQHKHSTKAAQARLLQGSLLPIHTQIQLLPIQRKHDSSLQNSLQAADTKEHQIQALDI